MFRPVERMRSASELHYTIGPVSGHSESFPFFVLGYFLAAQLGLICFFIFTMTYCCCFCCFSFRFPISMQAKSNHKPHVRHKNARRGNRTYKYATENLWQLRWWTSSNDGLKNLTSRAKTHQLSDETQAVRNGSMCKMNCVQKAYFKWKTTNGIEERIGLFVLCFVLLCCVIVFDLCGNVCHHLFAVGCPRFLLNLTDCHELV